MVCDVDGSMQHYVCTMIPYAYIWMCGFWCPEVDFGMYQQRAGPALKLRMSQVVVASRLSGLAAPKEARQRCYTHLVLL